SSRCRLVVLAEQAAEAVASAEGAGRAVIERGDGTRRFGRVKREGAVGPMVVVVGHIDAQYVFEPMARATSTHEPAGHHADRVLEPCGACRTKPGYPTRDPRGQ